MTKSKDKKKDKNTVYLSLDDLEKLYGIDKKIMKKIKKKQKKRRKKNKMKLRKDRTTQETNQYNLPQQMMNGISYKYNIPTPNTSLIDNREAQMIKEQIETLKKNNRLQIADVPENFVNNQFNKQILDELDNVKIGMKKIRQDGAETFNYLFDNIGDFGNQPINFRNPDDIDEEKSGGNRIANLSSLMYIPPENKSETIPQPFLTPRSDFYQDPPETIEPTTEPENVEPENDDTYGEITIRDDDSGFSQQVDDASQFAGTDSNRDIESVFTDPDILLEQVANPPTQSNPPTQPKPPFIKPPREVGEPLRTYNSRVKYVRKVYDEEFITPYLRKRWQNILNV
jgi:hypothetical protein